MRHFTISQPIPTLTSSYSLVTATSSSSSSSASLSPPHSLLSFPPLATLTNAIISVFNDLRACAPLALATELSKQVEELLKSVVQDVKEYHR